MVQDEPDTCRICSAPAEKDAPLFHPCRCSGTIRYIHQDCLTTWLAHSKKKTCDVCKYQYSFTKIYSDKMPEQIPFILFMRKLAWNTFWALLQAIRGVMVAIIWLAFLPFVTVWTWRLYFNMGENIAWWVYDRPRPNPAPILYSYYNFTLSSSRNGTVTFDRPIIDLATDYSVWRALSSDIFTGQIIAACIILMFLLVFLLREWIVQNARPGVFQDDLGNDLEEHDEVLEDVFDNRGVEDPEIFEVNVAPPVLEVDPADEVDSRAMESGLFTAFDESESESTTGLIRQKRKLQRFSDDEIGDASHLPDPQESGGSDMHRTGIAKSDIKNQATSENGTGKSPFEDFDFTFSMKAPKTEPVPALVGSSSGPSFSFGRPMEASSSPNTLETDADVGAFGAPTRLPSRPHLSECSIIDQESTKDPLISRLQTLYPDLYETKDVDQSLPSSSYVSTYEAPEGIRNLAGPSRLDDAPTTSGADSSLIFDMEENDFDNESTDWGFSSSYGGIVDDTLTSSSALATATDSPSKMDLDEYFKEDHLDDRDPGTPLRVDDIIHIEDVEPVDEPEEDIEEEPQDLADAQMQANEADMDGAFEAMGLRGPLISVFQHAALIIFVLDTTVGLAVWLPFTVGKITALLMIEPVRFLHIIHWPIKVIRWFTDPIVDFVTMLLSRSLSPFLNLLFYRSAESLKSEHALQLKGSLLTKITGQNITFSLTLNVTDGHGKALLDIFERSVNSPAGQKMEAVFALFGRRVRLNANLLKATWIDLAIGDASLNRFFAISLGYLLAGLLVSIYMNLLSVGNVQSAGRAIRTAVRQQLVILKVAFFIVTELVIFPFVCGSVLDLCSLPLFTEASLGTRISYFMYAPATGFFYHWLCGTMFMYQFAVILSSCRKLIRPGGMWFIKDPSDQNFQPIRDILDRPTIRQVKKLFVSVTMYLTVVVLGTFGMVVCFKVWGSVLFPIRWKSRQPVPEIPFDLLFLHIIGPSTMQQIKPRYLIYNISLAYWKWICKKLRISSYMFGGQHPDEMRPSPGIFSWFSSSLRPQITEQVTVPRNSGAKDGSYLRVPANDNIALTSDMRATVVVSADGTPLDDEGRRFMDLQNAEAEKAHRDPQADYMVVYLPPHFKWRVILFLISLWITTSILVSSLLAGTVWLGRSVLGTVLKNDAHDMYSFVIGAYLLWGCFSLGKLLNDMDKWRQYDEDEQNRGTFALYVFKRGVIRLSILAWVAFWLGIVIPVLISLVVEVYIIHPFRIMVNPTLTLNINILKSWALGLVYARIYFSTLRFRRQARIDTAVNAMRESGLMYLDVVEVTYEIIAPAAIGLFGMLFLPIILVIGLQQILPSKISSNTLFLYVYPGIFIVASLALMYKKMQGLFGIWAQQIRDTEFLVEMRLRNFDPPTQCDHTVPKVKKSDGKELSELKFTLAEINPGQAADAEILE